MSIVDFQSLKFGVMARVIGIYTIVEGGFRAVICGQIQYFELFASKGVVLHTDPLDPVIPFFF